MSMLLSSQHDREHQVLAFAGSTVITSILLMLLFFVKLYQTLPQTEAIEYIEVNFGTDEAGYGKIQTTNKASDSPRAEDVKKSDDTPKVKATPTPKVTPPTPKVETPKPVKAAPVKPPVTSKVESPVEVKEETRPVKNESKASTPAPVTPAKPAPEPKKVDENALFKKSSGGGKGSNGTSGTASGVGGNNNGDKPGTVGDQGNPNGSIDAKSLYGKPGGSATGVALNVSGWGMGARPQVNDDSDESGRIVFELTVDDTGDIVNVRVKESTVSQSVVEVYKRAVNRMKLVPKSQNVPATSKGTITFIIKSR